MFSELEAISIQYTEEEEEEKEEKLGSERKVVDVASSGFATLPQQQDSPRWTLDEIVNIMGTPILYPSHQRKDASRLNKDIIIQELNNQIQQLKEEKKEQEDKIKELENQIITTSMPLAATSSFIMKRIVSKRKNNKAGQFEYRIKWEDTWETRESLNNNEAINLYEEKQHEKLWTKIKKRNI